jgi:hypothetical protein
MYHFVATWGWWMRNIALLVNKFGKAMLAVVCLAFAVGQVVPVFASAQSLAMPSSESVGKDDTNVNLSDSFDVTGFDPTTTLLASVSVSGLPTATFSVGATGGLSLEYGYWAWTDVSSVAFTGTQSAVNSALDSLTFSAGGTVGQAVLAVSVQEKQSGTFFYEGTGNLYKYFPQYGVSYVNAKTQAAASTLDGLQGHLATITSQGEQDFVNSKIQGATNIWIAISDSMNEGIWRIDAGPEAGTTVWTSAERVWGWVNDSTTWSYSGNGTTESGQYSNWCGGEPNNSDWGNNGEDHAVTNWNGDTCWNDLSGNNVWSIGGYVVEYEAGLTAGTILTGTMVIGSADPAATTTTSVPPTTTTETPTTTTEPSTTTTEATTTTSEPQYPETTTTSVAPEESTTSLPPQESSTSTSSTTPVLPVLPVAPSTPDSTPSTEPPAEDQEETPPATSSPEIDESQEDSEQPETTPEPEEPESEGEQPDTTEPEQSVEEEQEVVSSEEIISEESEFDNLSEASLLMASISFDDAKDLFETLDTDDLSEEQAAVLVAAVQDAPTEIREVFEDTVDLFSGVFDDYMMLGSTISVGQRRTVVAVTAMTVAMGATSMPVGGTNSSTNRPEVKTAARKEEEEEPSGEIAGDGLEWIRKIKIFRNIDGVVKVDWKAFFKKFSYGVMNMGFTLAGSLVVFLTLSGTLQKIAGVSTVLAFAAALWAVGIGLMVTIPVILL